MAAQDPDEWKKKQKELAKKLRREAYQKQKAYAKAMREQQPKAEHVSPRPEEAQFAEQREQAKAYAKAQRKAAYAKAKEQRKAEQARAKAELRAEKLRAKEEKQRNDPLLQLQKARLAELAEKRARQNAPPIEEDASTQEKLLAEARLKTLN